ncbi:catechol 2,3-dioxygenase-like lactoylglutathione lyase family enzyme [Bacillus oleivorans]|uniref:Catechol 2,3-dioxygenase-like lactoylglutathione lyase family enzyme n=1 Tax=Bacillus oleivorans TaxID=1448271 RepID=A0A285D2H8_9BACI|nr:VOC family protein [Bacillus oleivorans]SNX74027.1 catechol 2,3-dioxygenase-like lactoylglutathione lyase family enzyme [Bacillus oleivorans]
MLNEICALTIKVKDIQESLYFYSELLGFQVSKYYGESIVSLQHKDLPIILEKANDLHLPPKGNVLPALVSEKLDEDIQALREKGVTVIFDEPKPCPPGRYTVIEDPTGNQIEILEFSK